MKVLEQVYKHKDIAPKDTKAETIESDKKTSTKAAIVDDKVSFENRINLAKRKLQESYGNIGKGQLPTLIYVSFDLFVRSNNVVKMFLFSCDHREKEETDSSPESIRTASSEMQTWEASQWFCTQGQEFCCLPLA